MARSIPLILEEVAAANSFGARKKSYWKMNQTLLRTY